MPEPSIGQAPAEAVAAASGSAPEQGSSVFLVLAVGLIAIPGLMIMTLLATVLTRR